MNSAVRRHHYRRLQKTRRNYWGRELTDKRELGMIANTPQPCSCIGGCGHMRQAYGLTRQELRV